MLLLFLLFIIIGYICYYSYQLKSKMLASGGKDVVYVKKINHYSMNAYKLYFRFIKKIRLIENVDVNKHFVDMDIEGNEVIMPKLIPITVPDLYSFSLDKKIDFIKQGLNILTILKKYGCQRNDNRCENFCYDNDGILVMIDIDDMTKYIDDNMFYIFILKSILMINSKTMNTKEYYKYLNIKYLYNKLDNKLIQFIKNILNSDINTLKKIKSFFITEYKPLIPHNLIKQILLQYKFLNI